MERTNTIHLVSTMEMSERTSITEAVGEMNRSHARPISIADEPGRHTSMTTEGSHHPRRRDDWLIDIMMETGDQNTGIRPRIQKIPRRLREMEAHKKCFLPAVASIGPYHHGNPKFEMIEKLKNAAARRFVSGCDIRIEVFYNKVVEVLAKAREYYAKGSTTMYDDEAFTRLMFLDGCFVLHFIECNTYNKHSELTTCCYITAFLLRDLFLLENQLPFLVLEVLMSVRFPKSEGKEMVNKFINHQVNPPGSHSKVSLTTSSGDQEQQPLHLLDLLRTKLLGDCPQSDSSDSSYGDWQSFRSIKELKTVGINFKRSRTSCLKDIRFHSYKVYGELSLPPIAIDDSTKDKFLNLIAFEMCPDASHDYKVTSYICFLDSLIDHAEDVKELRSKSILLNFLGSDEQVAELFNELANELVPDPRAYYKVKKGIERHYKSKTRISVVEFLHIHFSNPWTGFAFFAASFVVILTCIQTFYAVFPRK